MREKINPWIHLWFQPKKTLHSLLTTEPKRTVFWLALLAGISGVMAGAAHIQLELLFTETGRQQWPIFLMTIAIPGIVIGLIYLYLGAWLVQLTGSWLGGKGTYLAVKSTLGWSCYPLTIANISAIISGFLFQYPLPSMLFGLLSIILILWAFVLIICMTMQVHQFSGWRAIGTLLLSWLLAFIALGFLGLLFVEFI